MYKGKFRRAFPESFLFFHSFFYALTAGRRRRDIIKGRSSERSFFMSVWGNNVICDYVRRGLS